MKQKLVGVLGGMGPFASAEFVSTIYEQNVTLGVEQSKPRLVLCSDPDIPDRTSSIEAGENVAVTQKLVELWEALNRMGIEQLIVPCITSHYYVSSYPKAMQDQMVNLVDLTLAEVANTHATYLLLATNGTYRTGLLQHNRIVVPSDRDRQTVHNLVYTLKQQGSRPELLQHVKETVLELVDRYGTEGWISGCTEYHLLTRYMLREQEELAVRILDPLLLVARGWSQFAVDHERDLGGVSR